MKALIILFALFGPVILQAQSLCGFWYSYEYPCVGLEFETFFITQDGDEVICTKIKGDDCVTSGQISWQGTYNSNVFPVYAHVGNQSQPDCCYQISQIKVMDNNHLLFANFSNIWKMDCKEVDSLNLKFSDYGLPCDCHTNSGSMLITPNPFAEEVNVRNNTGSPILTVKIFNALGQLVFSNEGNNLKIDTRNFGRGVYVYDIETINGRNYNDKLIKL